MKLCLFLRYDSGSNFLTDALPLIIRPKPRGVPPFKNLDADGLPLVGLDEIGVSAFLSGREKRQHILGAGAEHSPERRRGSHRFLHVSNPPLASSNNNETRNGYFLDPE